jgi:hypothetical protein
MVVPNVAVPNVAKSVVPSDAAVPNVAKSVVPNVAVPSDPVPSDVAPYKQGPWGQNFKAKIHSTFAKTICCYGLLIKVGITHRFFKRLNHL